MAFPAERRYAHRHRWPAILDLPGSRANLVRVNLIHNVERNRDLLRAAGIPIDVGDTYLAPASWHAGVPRQDAIAVHVGSIDHDGLAAKRWPLQNFVALCQRLVAQGQRVIVIVGADERNESFALKRAVPQVELFESDLGDVARLLSRCSVAVANDSGIGHLSAAVGTPVISIFGPTPVEFAPYSPLAVALRPSTCPPCFDVRHPVVKCVRKIDFACLKRDVTVQAVLDAVKRSERTAVRAPAKTG